MQAKFQTIYFMKASSDHMTTGLTVWSPKQNNGKHFYSEINSVQVLFNCISFTINFC